MTDYFNYDYNYNNIYSNLRGVNIINNNINININNNKSPLELAGDIHKMIRYDIQRKLRPNTSIYDLSLFVNSKIREYVNKYQNKKQINDGIAFPPIFSVNNCIAHYSPTKETDIILKFDDNVKIDFGVHIDGYIVDSAFTVYFNKKYDDIHNCCKEALYNALKNFKIDSYIKDIGNDIQEIVDSYGFKIIKNVGGHNIERYNIHGGDFIFNYKNSNNGRIKKGIYAIEPFISYNSEYSFNGKENNNYRIYNEKSKLYEYFNNMIFTDTHIDYFNLHNIFKNEKKNLTFYPALYIEKNDIGVQYEHTVYVDENKTTIVSKGDDY